MIIIVKSLVIFSRNIRRKMREILIESLALTQSYFYHKLISVSCWGEEMVLLFNSTAKLTAILFPFTQ